MPHTQSENKNTLKKESTTSLIGLLTPYKQLIFSLVTLTVLANALNLAIPKIIANTLDTFTTDTFVLNFVIIQFSFVALFIFIFTCLQNIVQVYASERVARDIRNKLSAKISIQEYSFVDAVTPAKLLTNLTSDVDAVKTFVSLAIPSIISSAFLIIGASTLLVLTNWKLAIAVLFIIPMIGVVFFIVLKKVRVLFLQSQGAIDWLNKVINESILGSALIRLVNAQQIEYQKFIEANTNAKDISLSILKLFSTLIPIITFLTNMATLVILVLGGHFVITGTMTIGDFSAFNGYLAILVFPIAILSFMSNVIAQAQASFGRIDTVLNSPNVKDTGTFVGELAGDVALQDVTLILGEKKVLKDVTLSIAAGTRTAIIGPTAAGKTQLLYLLTGLVLPSQGKVLYDGKNISEYEKQNLYTQIGFVFQNSILFNMSLRENIAFSDSVDDKSLKKAIETAELEDFIETLPEKLNTIVSERGTSLSGGQKQRVMLARALALNPRVLILDDFTSRVDTGTEKKILENVRKNYPHVTLISVTQKIAAVEKYDQIVLLMDGELLAQGVHADLLQSSPEYIQIFNSQKSTENYELQS